MKQGVVPCCDGSKSIFPEACLCSNLYALVERTSFGRYWFVLNIFVLCMVDRPVSTECNENARALLVPLLDGGSLSFLEVLTSGRPASPSPGQIFGMIEGLWGQIC